MSVATIEWDKIGELLWVAPVATFALSVAYAMLILGVGRAAEARRAGDTGVTTAFTALAAVSGAAFAAIVAFGVIVIVSK